VEECAVERTMALPARLSTRHQNRPVQSRAVEELSLPTVCSSLCVPFLCKKRAAASENWHNAKTAEKRGNLPERFTHERIDAATHDKHRRRRSREALG
jgi:hypothetical protein